MSKIISLCTLLIGAQFSVLGVDKLPIQYQITYGEAAAPIKITEYFSFSCPKCLKSFLKDFKTIQDKYIETKQVQWTFHLNPADLLTLQAMICLEKLSQQEKAIFFEVVIENLDDLSQGAQLLQTTMEALGKPVNDLERIEEIKKQPLFLTAYNYLRQPGIVQELPTVEINGTIYDEYPHLKFIERKISSLQQTRATP